MLLLGLVVLAVVVAAAVVWGRRQTDRSYISFPCRVCGTTVRVAAAESLRRLTEAQREGRLATLGDRPIPCMKCGADQAPDWLLHPRTKQLLARIDANAFRAATAAEYLDIVHSDGAGAKQGAAALEPGAAPPDAKAGTRSQS